MRRIYFSLAAFIIASSSLADRSSLFGVNAWNAIFPAGSETANAAFSPIAFEHDCCALAEAFDSIGRANVAETMGVLTDFPSVYGPLISLFEKAPVTNRVELLSARAICVKEPAKADKEYRRKILELNGTSVCPAWPTIGVERWFKAKMDGYMEDYLVPASKLSNTGYTLLDVNYIGAELPDGVAVEALTGDFASPVGKTSLPYFKIATKVVFRYDEGVLSLKIPLKGGADLYIFTTTNDRPLSDARKILTADNFKSVVYNLQSVEGRGAKEAAFDLMLPKIDFTSSCDLEKGLEFANVAESGFTALDKSLKKRVSRQTVRVRVKSSTAAAESPSEPLAQKRKRMVIDRPFLFFIHMAENDLIPVMGAFVGADAAK